MSFVSEQTSTILRIGDVSDGRGSIDPQLFDPSLDVWFTGKETTIEAFRNIEERFVAEDFLIVAFEANDTADGVFDQKSLEAIHRLTNEFLAVPGVRHVRSLTHNPWIRWGTITDNYGSEDGLIVSDLVEVVGSLTSDDRVERMIAVIGAYRAAERVGADRVRSVLGADVNFDDYIGEPMLLGTLVNASGSTTALQVQLTRPYLNEDARALHGPLGAELYQVQHQRAALRAIEHILRREAGLTAETEAAKALRARVLRQPRGAEKDRLLAALNDSTKTFVRDSDGQVVQKAHEYVPQDDGSWQDQLNPEHRVAANAFTATPRSDFVFHVAGIPTFERNFEVTGAADAGLLPIVWLVIFVSLVLVFRNLSGALIPMLIVLVSVIGTVGAVFASGNLFNNLTAMLPNMLTVIGVADAVHLVAAYFMLRGGYTDRRELTVEVIRRNALPVFLTSITTAVGFYSLLLIDLAPVKQFGAALAAGSLLAYAVTMTLVPLLLSLLPLSCKNKPKQSFCGVFTAERSKRLAGWVVDRRIGILGITIAVTIVAIIGASRVQINADPRTMFPPDNAVMLDMQWIEDHLGGTGDLELVFSAPAAKPAFDAATARRLEQLRARDIGHRQGLPGFEQLSDDERAQMVELALTESEWRAGQIGLSSNFLGQLDRFEARVRSEMKDPASPLRFVTDLTSPLDILRRIHQVQNGNRAEAYRVPRRDDVHASSREPQLRYDEIQQEWWLQPGQDATTLVSQYYLQYENGARPGENLATQLSPDRRYFRMQGRLAMGSSIERQATYARLAQIAEQEIPELANPDGALQLHVSGKSVLVDATGIVIAKNYTKSIAVALAVIALFIGLVFRSVRFAFLSLIPNVFPILVPISLLGFLGIALDGPAIVACSIALGLCVDDTIHLFSKFRDAERQGLTEKAVIAYGFQECGNALTVTTSVLVFGFLMFATGDFSPNVFTGLLGALMIIVAYVADFLVTPAAFTLAPPRRHPTREMTKLEVPA